MYDFSAFPEHLKKDLELFFAKSPATPAIVTSKNQIAHNLNYFLQRFRMEPQQIYFPVKVNHDTEVLVFLKDQHICFEIASLGELELLKKIQVSPEKIFFSNPVKFPDHIKKAYEYGVRIFAMDSISEITKLALDAPGARVFLRLSVSNKGSGWKLDKKFGAEKQDALNLIRFAIQSGLRPCGISFHVGWNNQDIETFVRATEDVEDILAILQKEGINPEVVNLGGGFPAHDVSQYELLDKIAKALRPLLDNIQKSFHVKIIAEPGSFIMANTGVMTCSVLDVVQRKKQHWIFLDTGIFQGFQWIMGKLSYRVIYPYKTAKGIKFTKYHVTGPTCDSHDIFTKAASFPDTVKAGDQMLIYPAGAYIGSAKEYNGFGYPETQFL
ncbi:MAG TPA: alanine racemase [Bacteroidales bacterium]|nr:alanine racemase [Bacteroidales bacterium]